MTTTPTHPLITDQALADWLSLSIKSIRNRLCAGDPMPPFIRVGRTRRWDPDDVRAWLCERRVVVGGHHEDARHA